MSELLETGLAMNCHRAMRPRRKQFSPAGRKCHIGRANWLPAQVETTSLALLNSRIRKGLRPAVRFCTSLLLGSTLSLSALIAAGAPVEKDFLEALAAGRIDRTRELLNAGVSVEAEDEFGTSALMYACLYADAKTVRLLLDKGADPNHANSAGTTALMWAVSDPAKVRLLVERGANVNAVSTLTRRTPLVIAAGRAGSAGVVRLLLDKRADPNTVDKDGYTPVLAAAGSGDPEILTLLLNHGVDPNVKTTNFFTPLLLAGRGWLLSFVPER
jgi:hypothetical protein